jgi:hypothetical protein
MSVPIPAALLPVPIPAALLPVPIPATPSHIYLNVLYESNERNENIPKML